jgi:broad specificity phosphatase PhoE
MARGKKIVVIRHAQSKAQTMTKSMRAKNVELLDAPLSQSGQRQALEAVAPRDIDLIVCSPLTRTIQTACLIFRGADFDHIPIIAHPDASEFAVNAGVSTC